jgi:alpha-glucosidase
MTPAVIKEALSGWVGARGWPSWSLSNHDVVRFPTRLADGDPQRIKLMLALLLSLRGTPFLYQGDELGLPHAEVPFERLRDPEAIAFWPHGIGRDGARTPMPWAKDAPMAGFTSAPDAWLPLDPRHRALAVDAQEADPNSVLAFTREIVALRKASAALRVGEFVVLEAPEPVLMFERNAADERVLCVFNLGADAARVPLTSSPKQVRLALSGAAVADDAIVLPPYSALLVDT